jgi:hypothetical protein
VGTTPSKKAPQAKPAVKAKPVKAKAAKHAPSKSEGKTTAKKASGKPAKHAPSKSEGKKAAPKKKGSK